MSIKNKSHVKENPTIIRLRALSKRIQQYLKGEGLPPHTNPRFYLNDMLEHLQFTPESFEVVGATPNYKAGYEKVRDEALEIKQEYLGLAKLPSCEIEPTVGLRELLEWCLDSIGKITIETENEWPSGEAGGNLQSTPETDSKLIYQADGAEFYNIPKSTLSKAANKKMGEAGYLWSGRKKRRVFYRKKDLERLTRSRTKLSQSNA